MASSKASPMVSGTKMKWKTVVIPNCQTRQVESHLDHENMVVPDSGRAEGPILCGLVSDPTLTRDGGDRNALGLNADALGRTPDCGRSARKAARVTDAGSADGRCSRRA